MASPRALQPSRRLLARSSNPKDIANLQLQPEGRSTPLPQYEKTQSVPFTLTLQEEKSNPGQFQLVVNIDPEHQKADGSPPEPAASKKLFANLQAFPSLGYDVSPLYQTQKSSPPTSPQQDPQGWSDLDAIPPDFLQKVVPDWNVTFERSASTASSHSQSRRLADIKARIKKSGRGFVVRLLKGSSPETNEVAEVHLGQTSGNDPALAELDSTPRVELDATEIPSVSPIDQTTPINHHPTVFEIGTSSEPGIRLSQTPPLDSPVPDGRMSSIPRWLSQTTTDNRQRNSISEEGLSDADTLIPEIRSLAERIDDDPTDLEPFSTSSSRFPTRTTSVSSIVKTPTRGLSVVGPVRRAVKGRTGAGKSARLNLNRSDAKKSFKRRSPHDANTTFASGSSVLLPPAPVTQALRHRPRRSQTELLEEFVSQDSGALHHTARDRLGKKDRIARRSSVEEAPTSAKQKARLRLETNVPRTKSANNSPILRRKRSPRIHQPSSSSSSVHFAEEHQNIPSPAWSEVDASEELRNALERAFENNADDASHIHNPTPIMSVPRIEEPIDMDSVGEIPFPPNLEIRSAPVNTKNPFLTFLGLALSALSDRAFEGLHALRERYGGEPPVPPGHVRVRWTCSCGEQLYDDFIERRRGAARLLEAYLNRPRAHTPTSPAGRTSTSSTMSSVFSSVSTASTLATPSSTYGGPSSWGKGKESSKYSPTRLRSTNPFSVRIPSYHEEQWLLTCANEGRFTPKIVHIDVNKGKITSDKDLALALRAHYEHLNNKWLKWAKLRGLTTIEFVQFEVHRNRFADIRASPSMPPTSSTTATSITSSTSASTSESTSESKFPSTHPYSFEPIDLMPPVGSTYLLHLFRHPTDYDNELITYQRSPKRRERLESGMGWGLNLVEGFIAQKVWAVMFMGFGVGSAVFGIVWTVRLGDVQGAFGVAGWVVTLAGLVLGGLQAWLE
ncbi:uncharacterized protein BDR25DRAFT_289215 [Lindgomyces ingoldianus]|uniref:Uncharacterized protein n=1 Tax=Lindgomyces ingoldianus TaxID=673940 RepID=A0ACB6QR93_9PLEO|nr:uncharacterized protein BDR25DRAFT_289215 [Lindgomyces ingoldianus]KAF2469045.1 hypothetical protein BDR25DRAFT_289215 [Lindgomyces ingoldianus]